MNVEVRPAGADEAATVANLMSLYLFEFSAEQRREIGADGVFRYASLEAYWGEPGRYPFLILAEGKLAGFAFVAEGSRFDPDLPGRVLAEFFVLPTLRRRGVGQAAATALFQQFPGPWWVGQTTWNLAAQRFWRTVIGRFTGGEYREEAWTWEDEDGVAQIFTAPSV